MRQQAQDVQVAAPVVRCSVADDTCTADGSEGDVPGVAGVGAVLQPELPAKAKSRPPPHYLWAALIARNYAVFSLICPSSGGQMRIIAFITFSADINKILEHIGVELEAPRITPTRGPPLWDECGAQDAGEGVEAEPDWDMTARQHRTTRTISALLGEFSALGKGVTTTAQGQGCGCRVVIRLMW